MNKNNEIQSLLIDFIIDEGKYDMENYSQNIEIISSLQDSFAYQLKDPRLLLLSKKLTQEEIKKHEFEVMGIRGKLTLDGLIDISEDTLSYQDRIYRRGLMSFYLPEYPFLNEDASVIAYYDWSVDGMAQIFTLLENYNQDYFVGFGFRDDDPKALEKRIVVEHFITQLREDSSYIYDGFYEKYNNNELYMLAKSKVLKQKGKVLSLF